MASTDSDDDWGDIEGSAENMARLTIHSAPLSLPAGAEEEEDDDWGDLEVRESNLAVHDALGATRAPSAKAASGLPNLDAAHDDFGLDLDVIDESGGGANMLQLRMRGADGNRMQPAAAASSTSNSPRAQYNRFTQQWEGGFEVDMTEFDSSGDETEASKQQRLIDRVGSFQEDDTDDWDDDFADAPSPKALGKLPKSKAGKAAGVAKKSGAGPCLITLEDMEAQGIMPSQATPRYNPEDMLPFYAEDENELEDVDEIRTVDMEQRNSGVAPNLGALGLSPNRTRGRAGAGPTLVRPEDVNLSQVAGQDGQRSVFVDEQNRWVQVEGVYMGNLENRVVDLEHVRRMSSSAGSSGSQRMSSSDDFDLPRAVISYFDRCEEEHHEIMRLILGEALFRRLRREGKERLKARSPYLQHDDDSASEATSDSGNSDDIPGEIGYTTGTPDSARRRRSMRAKVEQIEAPNSGYRRRPASQRVMQRGAGTNTGAMRSSGWVRTAGPVRAQQPISIDTSTPNRPLNSKIDDQERILSAYGRQLRRFSEARRMALGRAEL